MSGIMDLMSANMNNYTAPPPAPAPAPAPAKPDTASKAMSAVSDALKPMMAPAPVKDFMPQMTPMPAAPQAQFQAMPMPQRQPMMAPATPMPQMVYSDVNLKTNISNTPMPEIDQFIKTITAKNFDYKDSRDGSHTEGGLMAQDLQKSKIGRSVVEETPHGLAVNTAKLSPIIASIMSQKVKSLESKIDAALSKKFRSR
jgi:hypothetical protein